MADRCPFCAIIAGDAPADIVRETPDAIVIRPLAPVIEDHMLVIPRAHLEDALEEPKITGELFELAARLAMRPCNLITSVGLEATQTVFHLHVHIVPRRHGDDLALPWSHGSIGTTQMREGL